MPQVSKECQVVGQIVSAERRNGTSYMTRYGAKSVAEKRAINVDI